LASLVIRPSGRLGAAHASEQAIAGFHAANRQRMLRGGRPPGQARIFCCPFLQCSDSGIGPLPHFSARCLGYVMGLRIPNLKRSRCRLLTACGLVLTEDPNSLRWLKEQQEGEWWTGRAMVSGNSVYVRARFRGSSGKQHFHVDVARADFFKSRGHSPPKCTRRMSEIHGAIAHLFGQKIDVRISGSFDVREASLPPVIRSTLVEVQAGNLSIRMTGGTLSVRGAPIDRIAWSLIGEKNAVVHLEGRSIVTIDESYLEGAIERLSSALRSFGSQRV